MGCDLLGLIGIGYLLGLYAIWFGYSGMQQQRFRLSLFSRRSITGGTARSFGWVCISLGGALILFITALLQLYPGALR
jgi:hypothetical protein